METRGAGILQGTVDGAELNSTGIGNGVYEYFCDSQHEVWYHKARLQPMCFVVDLAQLAGGRLDAEASHIDGDDRKDKVHLL